MKVLIGIDPGKYTGLAVIINGKLDLWTIDFWTTIEQLHQHHNIYGDDLRVYIEDPNPNKPVFFRKGTKSKVMHNIAQKVGSNKREASLLIEYCRLNGIKVFPQVPKKGSMTKLKADYFKRLTGCKGRSSEHARDAAMLIFGR